MDIKPKIELWDTVGTGIIIPFKSGVLVSNQTGGHSCLQPEVEGVYVPIGNDYGAGGYRFISADIKLNAYFEGDKYKGSGATSGIDLDDAKFIDSVIAELGLSSCLSVDLTKLKDSHEAWIWLNFLSNDYEHFSGFDSVKNVVLTWSNSD